VQALTGRPEERALHALLTHPRPRHAWPALERLAVAFRRAPVPSAPAPCPPLDMSEFRDLLLTAVAQELELAALTFEPVEMADGAEELQRQTAEALWQSLLADMRA
jgi:hypothetical protein